MRIVIISVFMSWPIRVIRMGVTKLIFSGGITVVLLSGCIPGNSVDDALSDEQRQQLLIEAGRELFFDPGLSEPAGQSCASCHDPSTGFADPDNNIPVSEGIHSGRFGNRNTPSSAYASFSPSFYFNPDEGLWMGGQFLDGRSEDLVAQAQLPLLNPVEMANPGKEHVVSKVSDAVYAPILKVVYGADVFDDPEMAFVRIAEALTAFEASTTMNRFDSKFDLYIRDEIDFTDQEIRGLAVFDDPEKGNCAACHPSTGSDGTPALFTDFSYDNLGVPKNPENPFYTQSAEFNPDGAAHIDYGLGVTVNDSNEMGKFKVSSLRNVEVTGPYMHNGIFKTLREVVEFYNTRDIDNRWGEPEVPETVNFDELGNLGLTDSEIDDLVAFLKTLTDGYQPNP